MAKLFVPLDVDWASDEKILDAGPLAGYLFLASLAFAKRTMKDGAISRGQLLAIAPGLPNAAKHAARLVDVGLWTIADGGWTIPAWLKHNPSKDRIEAASELASENGVRGNHIKHHVNEGKPSPRCRLCIDERLTSRSGTRGTPDRVPGADPIAKGREGKSEPEPEGSQSQSQSQSQREDTSSSSQHNSHPPTPPAPDDDDDLAMAALEVLADRWTDQFAKRTAPARRAYRATVITNADDHLPALRLLATERPNATAESVAVAYDAGSWPQAISPERPTHPSTCECDGTGWVPTPDGGHVDRCPVTEWPDATIHPIRSVS